MALLVMVVQAVLRAIRVGLLEIRAMREIMAQAVLLVILGLQVTQAMQEIMEQAVLRVMVALKALPVEGVIPEVLLLRAAVMRAAVRAVLRVPQMQQPVLLEVLVVEERTKLVQPEVLAATVELCFLLLAVVAWAEICITLWVKHPVLRELHRRILNKAAVVAAAVARQCNTTEK